MRTIDYREINPESALHFAREAARDAFYEAYETHGHDTSEHAFVSEYVNDYMSDVFPAHMESALAEVQTLNERRQELLASIETVMSGPCAMVGDELTPSAQHDVNFYRAQLAEVESLLWEALDACAQ